MDLSLTRSSPSPTVRHIVLTNWLTKSHWPTKNILHQIHSNNLESSESCGTTTANVCRPIIRPHWAHLSISCTWPRFKFYHQRCSWKDMHDNASCMDHEDVIVFTNQKYSTVDMTSLLHSWCHSQLHPYHFHHPYHITLFSHIEK